MIVPPERGRTEIQGVLYLLLEHLQFSNRQVLLLQFSN